MFDLIYINKSKTICLTGHRPKHLPWGYDETKDSCVKFKEALRNIFKKAIKYGIKYFLTGMAEGFDMIATEILLSLKQTYKKIKIIAVIPCKGQEEKWSKSQIDRYHKILNDCDNIVTLSSHYSPSCMNNRNRYMINHSSFVIACFNGVDGGTKNTINFAKQYGCKVRLINPSDYNM